MKIRGKQSGLTLIELIVAFTILLTLSTMALPLARVKVQREKETRLRAALSEIRAAIERYKDMADEGRLGQIDRGTFGYPSTLDSMVEGVTVQAMGVGNNPFGQQRSEFLDNRVLGSRASGDSATPTRSSLDSRTGRRPRRSPGDSYAGGSSQEKEQKIRFLRRIPLDPMTNSVNWGIRSVQDAPESMSWGGQNVFDVFTTSMDTALDGTSYSDW